MILYDAVVDDHNIACAVGMGVLFRWAPVGGPSGVTYADVTFGFAPVDHVLKIGQFSNGTFHAKLTVRHDGDAGGVVPAVFKSFEPVNKDIRCVTMSDISYYSAHKNSEQ